LVQGSSLVAIGWAAGAQEAGTQTHCHRKASSELAVDDDMAWAYDFVFDTTADGRQIKCLSVVDEYTRECLAIYVADAIWSQRVIEVLARLISIHGAPLFLRADNCPEFVSHAILEWMANAGIGTSLSDPGKPWQNGTEESFTGKFRDECLPWSGSASGAKPAWSLKPGGATKTRSGRTAVWTT
jgi:transposase InsO family protein